MIASDIHGSAFWCERLLEAFESEGADKLVLLGDLLYHGPRNDFPDGYAPKKVFAMLNGIKEKLLCVRGNCDSEVDQMVLEFPMMADYALLEADENYKDYILADIKKLYKKMLDAGATTFWETELGWKDFAEAGSLCHGWSALPAYYLTKFEGK